ncbi:MAG: phosphatase PAP2 family protein [Armatimonadia bacterium]|nr:phosphatase PAP2 family protein [Armatimonadia bacterium]
MDAILEVDRQLTLWINHHHHPALDLLFSAVSRLGDAGVAWLFVTALLLIFGGKRDRIIAGIFLAGLLATEFLAMPVLRDIWYRPRPFTYMESIRTLGPEWDRPSFPSAHAYLWGQAALIFAVAYPRLRWPLMALLVLSLYSRPYVGNHHVLDTLAGLVLGLGVGALGLLAASKLGVLGARPAAQAEPEPRSAGDDET